MILPLIRRNLVEPLLILRSRSPKLRYWKHLEKTQYYSREKLEEIQWDRLKKLWDFLWQNNNYYRKKFLDAGLDRGSLRYPSDISKLPILTKEEAKENAEAMISNGFSKEALLHFKTGGSTGKPLDIFITEECSELRNAVARRHDRWSGWEPGEPIGAVWGNPKLAETPREKLKHLLVQPIIYLDTMAVTDEAVLEFAKAWERKRPTLLFGHAHSIFLLACMAHRLGVDSIRPKGIISTSMTLIPHERRKIERVFGTKVTDRYGCEEVGLIACECEKHEGLHLNIEHLVIEFLKEDNTYAKLGEPGQIIVTDLMNFAMPFVRYKVEDIGVGSNKMCSCGRGLPLMDEVIGRSADFLIKPDGTKVAGVSLIENTLTRFSGIDQMQIIQTAINRIWINVVANVNFCKEVERELVYYFKKLFGPQVDIRLRLVNEISREPSGKYRFSICEVQG